jgi:hypothetical protein
MSIAAAADKRAGPPGPDDPGCGEAVFRTHFAAQLNDQGTYSAGGSG